MIQGSGGGHKMANWNPNTGNAIVTLLDGYNATDNTPIKVSYNLWITSFNVSLFTQYDNSQLHRGMSWFPIRRGEQMVNFSVDWPYQVKYSSTTEDGYNYNGFRAMQNFQNAIIKHQQLCIATPSKLIPMTFTFYNNNKTVKTVNDQGQVVADSSGNVVFVSAANEANSIIDYNLAINPKPTNEPTLKPLIYQGWIDTTEKEYARYKSIFSRSYRMNVLVPQQQLASDVNFDGIGAASFLKPTSVTIAENGDSWISTTPSYTQSIRQDWIPS